MNKNNNQHDESASGDNVDNSTGDVNKEYELLLRERELIQRERELLVRERELMNNTFRSLIHREWPAYLRNNGWRRSNKSGVLTALTLHASTKLRGAARLWYDGVPECATTWQNFKTEFLKAFPTNFDESAIHAQLMRRKKKKEETYEEYFYEMVAIAKKGSISDQTVIKYIIGGLNQPDLAKVLALQFYSDPIDLLQRIKNYEATFQPERYEKPALSRDQQNFKREENRLPKKCYNCNESGHLAVNCSRPKKRRCFSCNQPGHIASECTNKNSTGNNRASVSTVTVTDFSVMMINVDGHEVKALIDTGSDVNLIQSSVYLKIGQPTLQSEEVELLGLGTTKTRSFGSCTTCVKINGDEYKTKMLVVQDNALRVPVILGGVLLKEARVIVDSFGVKIEKLEKVKKVEIEEEKLGDPTENDDEANVFQIYYEEDDLNLDHVKEKDIVEQILRLKRDYDPVENKVFDTEL
ncbi:uncharacterized protein [Onthophagus taurus]|uniref:uncharacterized protein n=1 Tax=Onthophagus taurus TaxID=166361 RepID=UPI0039BEA631